MTFPREADDESEFPSLSGNSQPQFGSTSNPIWQRPTQQTAVQRPPQQSHANAGQAHPQANPQHPASPSNEDMFVGPSHLQGSLDDYRQAGQNQMTSRQPPSQSVDEFPPLGRNGTEGHDSDQRGAFGAFNSQNAFSSQQDGTQPRQGLPLGFGNPTDSTRSSSVVERTISPSSSNRPSQSAANNLSTLLSGFNPGRSSSANTQQQPIPDSDNRISDQKVEEMSDRDRYGLAGLLARINSDDPMVASMARGQDLTTLGLNLNSSDPLWPTWNGPFADANSRPLQPDFTLPECYTVTNVHQVRNKLPSFSDETLFWIFYTQPRDVIQELAASELTNRNWRFHKSIQMWLTKDITLPEPQRLTEDRESGSYVFFNHLRWEKVRRTDFMLEYHELAPTSGRMNGGG
ncbi:uncharacterized protein KY384_003382 [Bacidia gigantensis]|uniref:uncharacterized protein n=1 Tax=Bacidia gigantensis TaxID=2732470 RepID=UPI001D03C89F|nr:uncharacterized protein KY384_003382 [Bacidia gigantensis]KAG8531750.1 hypothetical protein KY384_003382 [Bacidia gigantensis]